MQHEVGGTQDINAICKVARVQKRIEDVPDGKQSMANKVGFDVGLLEDAPEDGAEGSRIHA
jgi:hypothetical protein